MNPACRASWSDQRPPVCSGRHGLTGRATGTVLLRVRGLLLLEALPRPALLPLLPLLTRRATAGPELTKRSTPTRTEPRPAALLGGGPEAVG